MMSDASHMGNFPYCVTGDLKNPNFAVFAVSKK
jgi:hypothetical protein